MSKQQVKTPKYAFPSRFGSHKSMQIKEIDDTYVVCLDEFGEYITDRKNLDSGLTDVSRCAQSRLGKLFQGKKEKDK